MLRRSKCIGKRKAHKHCEFGVKASIACLGIFFWLYFLFGNARLLAILKMMNAAVKLQYYDKLDYSGSE